MSQINQGYQIVNELTWRRKHQTMFVILAKDEPSERFIERSNRFVESINKSDTIKADVFILCDGNLIYLNDREASGEHLKKLSVNGRHRTFESVKDFASSCEYVQVCYLESTDI